MFLVCLICCDKGPCFCGLVFCVSRSVATKDLCNLHPITDKVEEINKWYKITTKQHINNKYFTTYWTGMCLTVRQISRTMMKRQSFKHDKLN